MKTSDFYYDLPKELIAQTPLEPRDSSRLLVLDREKQTLEHKHFYDIIDYLNEGDLLVANDSRVLPARIYGIKDETGAKVEFLLLKQIANNRWETLCKPGKKAKVGTKFSFGNGILRATVVDVKDDGNRIVDFDCEENFFTTLDKIGQMPLPPYITAELKDKERYQTVYSHELGSAAAPTAGLHFTTELMDRIKAKGVKIAYVTLHVGLGTFRPVKPRQDGAEQNGLQHQRRLLFGSGGGFPRKKNGGRVIAVGTTSCRTLESVAAMYGEIKPCEGFTDIFIYPGFEFKVLDGLITNFHLPESTLIMLVSAFAGYDFIMNAYKEAVKEKYRFFSFGDAMFIS